MCGRCGPTAPALQAALAEFAAESLDDLGAGGGCRIVMAALRKSADERTPSALVLRDQLVGGRQGEQRPTGATTPAVNDKNPSLVEATPSMDVRIEGKLGDN